MTEFADLLILAIYLQGAIGTAARFVTNSTDSMGERIINCAPRALLWPFWMTFGSSEDG